MPRQSGTDWYGDARRLRRSTTMNNTQIAAQLGVSRRSLCRFFDTDLGGDSLDLADIRIANDDFFIKAHVYRRPRQLDMGPIVRAARAAVEARRQS